MRYFYTDPIAAAWMAKHYSMKYVGDNSVSLTPYDFITCDYPDAYEWAKDKKFIIHLDSLGLLEPQVGDVVMLFGKYQNVWSRLEVVEGTGTIKPEEHRIRIVCSTPDHPSVFTPLDIVEKQGTEIKIIQRNGLPFMWPETE